jgi:dTDP-4-amino-4,6-dideoxygalactose transaminase
LTLALSAAADGGGRARTVALPAYACFDVAAAAVAANVRVVLYDVDPDTLGPDPSSLEAVVAAGAGTIVVAPLYGVPLDWAPIDRITARHDATVIEDAAQGHGAAWRGQPVGSFATLTVLSFGRGKGWTCGSGGALLARHDAGVAAAVEARARTLRAAPGGVRTASTAGLLSLFARPASYRVPASMPWLHLGETRYHEPASPRGLPRLGARILMATEPYAAQEADARRHNAAQLNAMLELLDLGHATARRATPPPASTPGWIRLPVRLGAGMRSLPSRGVADALGIASGYPATLASIPELRSRLAPVTGLWRWPGAEALVRELITLPTHSLANDDDRKAIVEQLRLARA